MKKTFRIALAQINVTVGDLGGNAKKMIALIKKGEAAGCDLIAFPEMALCGYPPQDLLHKDHFIQENLHKLREIARQTKNIIAIVGCADKSGNGKIYNAAAVLSGGRVKDVFHKQNLPNYGVFDERRYFEPGNSFKMYSARGVNFVVNICEDIWIEKGLFTQQAKSRPDIMINISSSPFDLGKYEQRKKLIQKRAKQARANLAYINLIGGQDELVFDGGSLFANGQGKLTAAGKQFEEDFLMVDIEIQDKAKKSSGQAGRISLALKPGKEKKSIPKPALPVHYSQIERIYKALVLGTRDYMAKNSFKKVVIGLSGGIDSALVAAVAVDALGADNVVGISMPSRYSSQETQNDAIDLAKNLGIACKVIAIEEAFGAYLNMLSEEFKGTKPDLTEENLQARIRGNIIMALSNKYGWLVLTTGNKSEVAVGYCTLYGDMSGGFAAIKDVPKTKVYELANYRNSTGKAVIPQTIIDRPPSAELRPGQKDSDSLPEYPALDAILENYIERHQSLAQMVKSHDQKTVEKVISLVDKSEYKRRQAPPGIKITLRSFDKDWRLPITNKYKDRTSCD